MATWTDAKTRKWTIKLTGGVVERVLNETGFDLAPEMEQVGKLVSLLLAQRKLGQVLSTVSTGQTVDRSDFLDGLDGAALRAGWDAIVDAAIEFLAMNDSRVATSMRETIAAQLRMMEKGFVEQAKLMKSDAMNVAMDAVIRNLEAEAMKNLNKMAKGTDA